MAAFANQIPFLELVEAQEVKKVRYRLSGGTPFAKTDIDEVRGNEPQHTVDVLDDMVGLIGQKTTKAQMVIQISVNGDKCNRTLSSAAPTRVLRRTR